MNPTRNAMSWEELAIYAADPIDQINGLNNPYSSLRLFNKSESEAIVTLYRDNHAWCPYCQKVWLWLELKKIQDKMDKLTISPSKVSKFGVNIAKDGVSRNANQVLSQKSVDMFKIREIWPEIKYVSREIDEQIEIKAHYKGYLKKQNADILAFKRDENLIIPENLDYDRFSGLSNEVKTKFKKIRPKTMGQALRIDGITPAAVYILLSHLKRKSIKHIA